MTTLPIRRDFAKILSFGFWPSLHSRGDAL